MSPRRGRRWVRLSDLVNRCRRCNRIIASERLFCCGCLAFLTDRGQGFW